MVYVGFSAGLQSIPTWAYVLTVKDLTSQVLVRASFSNPWNVFLKVLQVRLPVAAEKPKSCRTQKEG